MLAVKLTPVPPLQPPRQGKDIEKAKSAYNESRKRKREPAQRSVGRPTRSEVLTKIVNESSDKDDLQIYSQELILTANDGTEKKRKTILTKYGKNIECRTNKQFNAFDLVTDKGKKALEKIKKLNQTESLLIEATKKI